MQQRCKIHYFRHARSANYLIATCMSLSIRLFNLFLLTLMACNQSSEGDKALYDEAIGYHFKAAAVQEVVEPQIDQIDSLHALLTRKPGQQALVTSLDSLKTAFAEWEANVVEVPGMNEHTHVTGEHHHHDHTPNILKELPASQMRDLQREMLTSIQHIRQRTEQVMKQVKTAQE